MGRAFLPVLALALALCGFASAAGGQDFTLHGVSASNELVSVDLTDFDQVVVAPLSVAGITGIEYDPAEGRALALSNAPETIGGVYVLDPQSGALTFLFDLFPFASDTPSFFGLAYDALVFPERLYAPQPGAPNQIISVERAGESFGTPVVFTYGPADQIIGASIRPSSGELFVIIAGDNGIAIIEELTGQIVTRFGDNGVPNLRGMAFHPLTEVLYGATADGVLVEIDTDTGAGTVLRTYGPGEPSAVSDLAFLPALAPTPTPTATPTASAPGGPLPTATPTPTATPDATVCTDGGGVGGCACGEEPLTVAGNSVCAPVDTLTGGTVPPPPQVIVRGRRVTLLLAEFGAFSDGRTITRFAERAIASAREHLAGRSGGRISIRYRTVVRKVGTRGRDTRTRLTKRNTVTIGKLTPGSYVARYRVEVRRRGKRIARTKFSPSTSFEIGSLPR